MGSFSSVFHGCARWFSLPFHSLSSTRSVSRFLSQALSFWEVGGGRMGVNRTFLRDLYTWPWMMNVISPGGNGHRRGNILPRHRIMRECYVPENNSLGVPGDWVSGRWEKMWSEWLLEIKILRTLLCHAKGKYLVPFFFSFEKVPGWDLRGETRKTKLGSTISH